MKIKKFCRGQIFDFFQDFASSSLKKWPNLEKKFFEISRANISNMEQQSKLRLPQDFCIIKICEEAKIMSIEQFLQ